MTAKTYLNQLRSLEATIAARKAEAERLKAERTYLQGVSYDSDRVQHSASHNAQFEHLADIIADTERHITETRNISFGNILASLMRRLNA